MNSNDKTISSGLRNALRKLRDLTDAEQKILEAWLSSGWRTWLYRVGVGDEVIGRHRSDIEDHDRDRAPFVGDGSASHGWTALPLVDAICSFRNLSKQEFDAIALVNFWEPAGFARARRK